MSSRRWIAGFLLVEAALTAAVLGVGLVFITRSLSNHLGTLSRLQQYEILLRLAESQFAELEVEAQRGQKVPARIDVSFDAPYEVYQWTLAHEKVDFKDIPQTLQPLIRLVTLTVSSKTPSGSKAPHGPQVSLKTIWPAEWVK